MTARLSVYVLAASVALSGCQLQSPTDPPISNTDVPAAGYSQAQLSRAFAAAAEAAVEAAETEDTVETGEKPGQPKGLFAFLKPRDEASPLTGTEIEVVAGTYPEENATLIAMPETVDQAVDEAQDAPVKKANTGGLFAFLKPKHPAAPSALAETEPFAARPETHGVPAVLPAPDETSDVAVAPETPETPEIPAPTTSAVPKKPLFGFLTPKTTHAAPKSTVQPGEILPFGEVGIACEVNKRSMGHEVDQFPREGTTVWRLFDTDPANTGPRTQFITGFADGCPRQVTAALVMFGAADLHEVLRYSEGDDREWTKADKSYEAIKSATCGVKRKQRCPADKVGLLEKQLAFVSVYPTFGAPKGWLELLLHNGDVMSEEIR
ncbi:MAG: hypothetical protein KJ731_19070 [Alphaproteobacteria bacterium]|nr:hypothetical protein [Alphaproteobacteria bacterium]MBU1278769.1 hypothetical protein [Alphaproteobacteria bacterium]MBU1571972.1 hypothetical protein [Alphaproteobacteria bacterium]MBU1830551.1 hypothetical protein [Alphaproteobacteria bacterium]MBU2078179.1 hypothetical protein [Alphaproteobacteria bacterium]